MRYLLALLMALVVSCGKEEPVKKTSKNKECTCTECTCETSDECTCEKCECSCEDDRSDEGGGGDPCDGGSCPPPNFN